MNRDAIPIGNNPPEDINVADLPEVTIERIRHVFETTRISSRVSG